MTTVVGLSDAARARADELIRSGRYTTFAEVVEAALDDESWIEEDGGVDTFSSEDRDAIEEGLADIEAGRVHSLEEVVTHLRTEIAALRR